MNTDDLDDMMELGEVVIVNGGEYVISAVDLCTEYELCPFGSATGDCIGNTDLDGIDGSHNMDCVHWNSTGEIGRGHS